MTNNQMPNGIPNKNKPIYVTKEQKRKQSRAKSKYMGFLILIVFSFLFFLVTMRTLKLEISHSANGYDLTSYAEDIYTQVIEQIANRGSIYASTGEPLAINISTFDMYAVLDKTAMNGEKVDHVEDPDATADALLEALNLSNDTKAYDLFHSQLNNEEVANEKYGQVEFGTYGRSLSIEEKEAVEALNIPGIKFKTNSERYYPYGDFASYIVGFTSYNENGVLQGQLGVESVLDGYLRGQDAVTYGTFDGNAISISDSQASLIEKTDGSNIELTIDANVQGYIQAAMDEFYDPEDFDAAFTIVMDLSDGGILGAYAMPSYNPNTLEEVSIWYNIFTDYCYEPGSTVKPFLVATAMENGVWNPSQIYDSGTITKDEWGVDADGDPIYISDVTYNLGLGDWGDLTWEQGLFLSSNVGMVNILDAVTDEVWENYATNTFKFGHSVSSDITSTLSCDFSPTYSLDYATSTFGQGITANALQMLRAYSAIANDGEMLNPHFIKSMTSPSTGETHYSDSDDKTMQPQQVMTKENSEDLVEILTHVVNEGEDEPMSWDRSGTEYSKYTDIPLAGKTGTSEISTSEGYSDLSESQYIDSVMLMAPSDDPQILVYTVRINGTTGVSGFKQSAPPANGKIITNTINYLNSKTEEVDSDTIDANTYYLEDFRGKDISETKSLLNEAGIKTTTIGSGEITSQYPESAQEISKNQIVVLKGDADFDPTKLKGKTYQEAISICYAQNWDCSFDGLGIVSSIEQDSDTKFTISMTTPTTVAEDIKSKEIKEEENDSEE